MRDMQIKITTKDQHYRVNVVFCKLTIGSAGKGTEQRGLACRAGRGVKQHGDFAKQCGSVL